jgi:hypothetical protein
MSAEGATSAADDAFDNPIERLELLAGDDDAIAAFLDEIDVRSARERQMLGELARTATIAHPEDFDAAHRRVVASLETLARHGYVGAGAGRRLGPLRAPARFLVRLVARYLVVSYLRTVSTSLRNLYWLREIESPSDSRELELLRPARFDAQALADTVFRQREIGLPSFVIGGLLIPAVISLGRLTGVLDSAVWASVAGVVGTIVALVASWVVLRGTAMASRRIRLATREPLRALWVAVGNCGDPPRDQSRMFATVAIVLTVIAWIVLPALVGLALAT